MMQRLGEMQSSSSSHETILSFKHGRANRIIFQDGYASLVSGGGAYIQRRS